MDSLLAFFPGLQVRFKTRMQMILITSKQLNRLDVLISQA